MAVQIHANHDHLPPPPPQPIKPYPYLCLDYHNTSKVLCNPNPLPSPPQVWISIMSVYLQQLVEGLPYHHLQVQQSHQSHHLQVQQSHQSHKAWYKK